jgi:hypothetical protein
MKSDKVKMQSKCRNSCRERMVPSLDLFIQITRHKYAFLLIVTLCVTSCASQNASSTYYPSQISNEAAMSNEQSSQAENR